MTNILNNELTPIQLSVGFDLQGLSSGVYFVKVFTESGKLVGEKKILKQ